MKKCYKTNRLTPQIPSPKTYVKIYHYLVKVFHQCSFQTLILDIALCAKLSHKFVICGPICNRKVRVQKSYNPYTTTCEPFLPCSIDRSFIYSHLASPNSNCLPALSLIRCNQKTDRLNHTTLYAIHISDHVFPHRCFRENACTLFTDYIHSESTDMFLQHKFLQKLKSLIIPEILVSSLPPLSFCNMSSTTYQTQRKISNIAKLSATELLTLLFPSVLLNPKIPICFLLFQLSVISL